MSQGPKRGLTYTWIPNHLAATDGRVNPRSLLKALRTAVKDTADQPSEHPRALHYDSIKRGVQEASKIRVSFCVCETARSTSRTSSEWVTALAAGGSEAGAMKVGVATKDAWPCWATNDPRHQST